MKEIDKIIYISHRGNLFGREIEYENSPTHILKALAMGFDVEIDVWYQVGQWFLGHDKPQYHIPKEFLVNDRLWCHAKKKEALVEMIKGNKIHCFWHENDERTITSKGYVWTHKNSELIEGAICVLPNKLTEPACPIGGICSDEIFTFKFDCCE
jgi:hypothetical protein